MAWNEQTSLDRIMKRWDKRTDMNITVSKLGREMELQNITLPMSKRLRGVHAYATVAGSGQLDALDDHAAGSKTVRVLSAWLRESDKVACCLGLPVIAAQGARLHMVNYRPIDNDAVLARDAILLAATLRWMTVGALNPLLETVATLNCRTGLDLGEAVGTRGGTGGDSELLFLGAAANRGAKLLGSRKIVASSRLIDALGDQLELTTEELDGADAFAVSMTNDQLAAALEEHDFDWTIEKSTKRLEEDLDKWTADRCGVGSATTQVYFDGLGRSKSKLIETAVIIVDIDGFSDYIEALEDDEEKEDAIVALDIMRHEFREVLKTDYSGGVRVQYQGDNMIGLVHMPGKSTATIAERALDIAAGLQASMQPTLPKVVNEAKKLTITVGVALADTLATQLGPHGRRDAMVVGPAVTKADRISAALTGTEVGFAAAAYEVLPEHLQKLFSWSKTAGAWVAKDLPADKLDLVKEAHALTLGEELRAIEGTGRAGRSRVLTGAGAASGGAEVVRPFRPYAQ